MSAMAVRRTAAATAEWVEVLTFRPLWERAAACIHTGMTSTRPSFDEAIAFWRELLRSRGLPDRLVWLFAEDEQRPRSSGAGEWLARRAYRSAPASDTLVFAAYASADGHTIVGLQAGGHDAREAVRRDDWNLLFDAASKPGALFSIKALCEQMTIDERQELRRTVLQDLVLFTSPLTSVQHALQDLAWDSPDVWMVDKQHVLSILRRFEQDDINGADVEAWANAIETRDDIGYDRETAVWDVLYELANPTLTEPLTRERADVLASVLKGH
jgi:hypothetical protein